MGIEAPSNTTRRIVQQDQQYRGQWVARAQPYGDGGWVASLELPLPDGQHGVQVTAFVPPGTLQRLADASSMYASQVSGYGFEDPCAIDCGYGVILAPSYMGEVGGIEDLLTGLGGSLLGGALGGGGGGANPLAALGGLGSLVNTLGGGGSGGNPIMSALGGLLGGGGGSGGLPGVLGSLLGGGAAAGGGGGGGAGLPAGGTDANRQRLLQFLGITATTAPAQAISLLQGGSQNQNWRAEDRADAAQLANAIATGGAAATNPAAAAASATGLAGLLGQVLSGQAPAQAAAAAPALLAAGSALVGSGAAAVGPSGTDLYGPTQTQTLDLVRRTLRGLDATAAALGGDPAALDLVRRTRERTEADIANTWNLMDSLTRFMRG